MSISIRPALAADQATIVALIRRARLNPRNLRWSRFLVAEESGRIVGVRQVKLHQGGTREVASGFVVPEHRRQGISARLMTAILEREPGPLYLICDERWSAYYEAFGFQRMPTSELPRDLRGNYYLGKLITTVVSLFMAHKVRLVPMKRPASPRPRSG
jgi:N-acetylglutamate synthase-like GNAT family acetyltransferase